MKLLRLVLATMIASFAVTAYAGGGCSSCDKECKKEVKSEKKSEKAKS